MSACRACCEALKTNAVEKPIEAKQLLRLNQMLDAIEGNSNGCAKAHVCTVRAMLQDAATKKPSVDAVKRSKHCHHCRWTLKNHIPSFESDDTGANAVEECDLLTFDSLKTLVDWSCSKGEEMRKSDPNAYDDVLASFAWRAREQMQLGARQEEKSDESNLRKVAPMF